MTARPCGRTAFVFPGQGAQYVGMYSKLLGGRAAARRRLVEAEDVLGWDLGAVIEHGPDELLQNTARAQPALLTVSVACAEVLMQEHGLSPDVVMGHSVGEYAALVISGATTFSDGVRLVAERGRLMDQASRSTPGGMLAVIGAKADELADVVRKSRKCGVVEITNDNAPSQQVLSGERTALEEAARLLRDGRLGRAVPLRVSAPFHCALMRPMADEFRAALHDVAFSPPSCEFVANVSAEVETDPAAIRENLVAQLYRPVLWRRSVEATIDAGVGRFVESGPGRTLVGLVRRIQRSAELLTSETLLPG